jgi:hypothetical protein
MQVLPSDESVEAGAALAALIAKIRPGQRRWSDEAFEAREQLWSALAAGQWTLAGAPDGDEAFSLTDLTEIAVAWGRHALPVPLIPTILVRRWSWDADSPAQRPLTFGVPAGSGDKAWVPFAGFPGMALMGAGGQLPVPRPDPAAASFDLLMPAPLVPVRVPSLTPVQTADVCSLALAEAIGVAGGVLSDTVAHARSREQFGRAIGSFQAVKHHCADMHIDVEIARALLGAVTAARPGEPIEPALSDAFARLRRVVEVGIQVHGAMGFAWETGLHFGLRHVAGLGDLATLAIRA